MEGFDVSRALQGFGMDELGGPGPGKLDQKKLVYAVSSRRITEAGALNPGSYEAVASFLDSLKTSSKRYGIGLETNIARTHREVLDLSQGDPYVLVIGGPKVLSEVAVGPFSGEEHPGRVVEPNRHIEADSILQTLEGRKPLQTYVFLCNGDEEGIRKGLLEKGATIIKVPKPSKHLELILLWGLNGLPLSQENL
jgi:hypothetical protein